MTKFNLRKTILAALFCALAVVGAFVKFGPGSSIALDAMPAFLAALLMGGPYGAIVAVVGHMVSAAISMFPMSLPLHLAVAVEMGIIAFAVGLIAGPFKKTTPLRVTVASVAAFILNGFVSPLILVVWPGMGWGAYAGMVWLLALASGVNAAAAYVLFFALRKPYDSIVLRS